MNKRVYARIDLDALEHNIDLIKTKTDCTGTKVMCVIKADAYGHGAVPFAKFLQDKCDYFGVATIEEALELRNNGIELPILILGYTFPESYDDAIENNVSLTIFRYEDAVLLDKTAEKMGARATIHIAVDTGMNRIGFEVSDESADAASKTFELKNIKAEGLFSHYATSDEADKSHALAQKELFDKFIGMLKERGYTPELLHLDNSAGIMEMPDSFYGMVRAGIMLYGLYPSEEVDKTNTDLHPVMELISHISHIKTLPEGEGISYGRTYVTDRQTTVATIPVGYADGYPRCLSNKGTVLVKGIRCPILGRICMDQMMVDVTAVADVHVGDEVVLFGHSDNAILQVEEIAAEAYSFNYEFVCGISRRVPRVYYRNGDIIENVSYLIDTDKSTT